MLTTPQIAARTGPSRPVVAHHLGELERAGIVGRIAGKPARWYWRGDGEQVA
jgi:DNA-binding IscR family transcriptional regulator